MNNRMIARQLLKLAEAIEAEKEQKKVDPKKVEKDITKNIKKNIKKLTGNNEVESKESGLPDKKQIQETTEAVKELGKTMKDVGIASKRESKRQIAREILKVAKRILAETETGDLKITSDNITAEGMTKQHFEALAEIINKHEMTKKGFIDDIVNWLKGENDDFAEDLFREAVKKGVDE